MPRYSMYIVLKSWLLETQIGEEMHKKGLSRKAINLPMKTLQSSVYSSQQFIAQKSDNHEKEEEILTHVCSCGHSYSRCDAGNRSCRSCLLGSGNFLGGALSTSRRCDDGVDKGCQKAEDAKDTHGLKQQARLPTRECSAKVYS